MATKTSTPKMERNKAVVQQILNEVIGNPEANLDLISKFYTPDCKVRGAHDWGTYQGYKALLETIGKTTNAFTDQDFKTIELIADGDCVAAHWSCTSLHADEFEGMKACNGSHTVVGMTICELQDGKVCEVWQILDPRGLACK